MNKRFVKDEKRGKTEGKRNERRKGSKDTGENTKHPPPPIPSERHFG